MSSGTLCPGKRRLRDAGEGCALLQVHGEEGALHLPDVAHLGPVLQEPAVGHLVLPAHVPGVLPQQPDLVAGVPGVPQGVAEMLPRTRLRLNGLDNDTSEVLECTDHPSSTPHPWGGDGVGIHGYSLVALDLDTKHKHLGAISTAMLPPTFQSSALASIPLTQSMLFLLKSHCSPHLANEGSEVCLSSQQE